MVSEWVSPYFQYRLEPLNNFCNNADAMYAACSLLLPTLIASLDRPVAQTSLSRSGEKRRRYRELSRWSVLAVSNTQYCSYSVC